MKRLCARPRCITVFGHDAPCAGAGRRLNTAPDAESPKPKTIFSGIQPSGVPHLGNYLGALRQWVRLQDKASPDDTLVYSLVDLHAITLRQPPGQLRQWKKESIATLLAIGLDAQRSIIFHQSDVPAHAELMWILSCQASTGYLARMTQWKEKTDGERENGEGRKLGLFSYPVLQAADVLLHRATHVPVGHDQAQHLEFARQCAASFNAVYGNGTEVLIQPETVISPAKRIMSLADPTSKMSKSASNPRSRILLTDSEEIIRDKIRVAVTDSNTYITYEPGARPGVSNLIDILYHVQEEKVSREEIVADFEGVSFKALKSKVTEAVEGIVGPIRERYGGFLQNDTLLRTVAEEGREKATQSAAKTMDEVKEAVGLS